YGLASALGGVRHGERALSTIDLGAVASRRALVPLIASSSWIEGLHLVIAGLGPKAYAVVPREAGPTRVQIRGNPQRPGPLVAAGGVAAINGLGADFGLAPAAPERVGRIRLASWVTDRRNPLIARVVVNRLWQSHFGAGLVETPSDLGFNGGMPSHPELL